MKKIKVQYGQSIFDIATMQYGSIDSAWLIVDDNKLASGLDTDFFGGEELLIRTTGITSNNTSEYFKRFDFVINNSDLDEIEGIVSQLRIVLLKIINEINGNGAIMIDVFGGVAPYTFEWRIQDTDQLISTSQNLINASAGTYKVKVTDSVDNFVQLEYLVISVDENVTYLTDDFGNIIVDENGNPIIVL
jgi:hypothetical protein